MLLNCYPLFRRKYFGKYLHEVVWMRRMEESSEEMHKSLPGTFLLINLRCFQDIVIRLEPERDSYGLH